jgi:hypothetical protein
MVKTWFFRDHPNTDGQGYLFNVEHFYKALVLAVTGKCSTLLLTAGKEALQHLNQGGRQKRCCGCGPDNLSIKDGDDGIIV